MNYAIVIVDGASGWPRSEWDGQTSLEHAKTPNLTALARQGTVGLAETVPEGLEPSSSVACTSICGYDPAANFVGRGAIEGAALGIDPAPGQVVMRMNFCSVDEEGRLVSYSTGNMSSEDAHALVDEINEKLGDGPYKLVKGVSFRSALVVDDGEELLQGTYTAAHNLADKIMAPYRPSGPGTQPLLEYLDAATHILRTSEVNARRLEQGLLPANQAWAFWPGTKPHGIRPFCEVYGKKAALSSGVDLLKGIAKLSSIEFVEIPGVTDGYDNDYAAQAQGCIDLFDRYDLVICHVEAPDTAGHEGDGAQKVRAIERIDREILSRFMEWGNDHELRILALPDHPTPLDIKTHSKEPVPFVMAGPGIAANGAHAFTEAEAKETGLIVDPGYKLMAQLFDR